MKGRNRHAGRDLRVRQLLLAAGREVELPCRLRRTSARGWGPWTEGVIVLAARGERRAEWRAGDPLAIGRAPSRATEPFPLTGVVSVVIRPARFREEAFHGPATDILVVTAERSVIEFCVPPEEMDEVAHRLAALT